MQQKLTFFLFLCLLFSSYSYAQSVSLTVEAIYPQDQAEFVYQPLKEWLQQKTGYQVNIQVAENYYFYWRDAKLETPDFTLDAPHVAAYRIQEKNYQPILRVATDNRYFLVTNQAIDITEDIGKQLVGKRVITLPSPNLGSILYDQWFTDLFLQPQKIVTALSWEDAIEQMFSREVDAAIIPQSLYELYPNFLVLKESKPFPGQTFLVSPFVSSEIKLAFTNALKSINESSEAYQILQELNADALKPVNLEDYDKLTKLLVR